MSALLAGFNFDEFAILKVQISYKPIDTHIVSPAFHLDRLFDSFGGYIAPCLVIIYLRNSTVVILFPSISFIRMVTLVQHLFFGVAYGY